MGFTGHHTGLRVATYTYGNGELGPNIHGPSHFYVHAKANQKNMNVLQRSQNLNGSSRKTPKNESKGKQKKNPLLDDEPQRRGGGGPSKQEAEHTVRDVANVVRLTAHFADPA